MAYNQTKTFILKKDTLLSMTVFPKGVFSFSAHVNACFLSSRKVWFFLSILKNCQGVNNETRLDLGLPPCFLYSKERLVYNRHVHLCLEK